MAFRPVPYIDDSDSYIAFLPQAHVLELCAEHVMLLLGIKIGYSSPNTLTNTGTMVPKGGRGDATVLQPTYMAAVPLILDRVYKGIQVRQSCKTYFLFSYKHTIRCTLSEQD